MVVEPGDRYWGILREQLTQAKFSGPLVTDASLAALALEQGATLCSADRAFLRFTTLKRLYPTQDTQEPRIDSRVGAIACRLSRRARQSNDFG